MDENKEINDVEACENAPEEAPIDCDAQIAELNDKYLRAAAELENTRRRAAVDAQNLARSRAMSVAEKFLPLIDAIAAAQKASPEDQGIESMARASASVLAQIGISRMEAIGQIMNPSFHNVISVVETPNAPANTIIEELQAGYMFGDAVMRPAMVIVAK
jgi:molecular chaperone GrpE